MDACIPIIVSLNEDEVILECLPPKDAAFKTRLHDGFFRFKKIVVLEVPGVKI